MISGGKHCSAHRCGEPDCGRCRRAALDIIKRLRGEASAPECPPIVHLPVVAAGKRLCLTAQPADAVFVIRRGALKRRIPCWRGRTGVSGFLLPGSVIGPLPQFGPDCEDELVALEETSLGRVRANQCCRGIRHQFLQMRCARLRDEHEFLIDLISRPALQRVTGFLLRVSTLLDEASFHLPMADSDIADYLGVSPEALRSAQHQLLGCGWVQRMHRTVTIKDRRALQRLLGG